LLSLDSQGGRQPRSGRADRMTQTENELAEQSKPLGDDASGHRPDLAAPPQRPHVVLLGNPNVGKTSLFNHLTGQSARVGNYPGITVERRVGRLELPETDAPSGLGYVDVVDVPGTYSLAARSQEERIAIDEVMGLDGKPPALAVVVVDAGQLVRNLYLVVQLLELRMPCVVALNMMDEVAEAPPEPAAIERIL